MLGALNCEGTAVGVLAEGLLRAAISTRYRKGLMARNLVLVSPFNPEAGFDVGNAMARNKCVYCLSDAAIVVAVDKEKGGTWNGAIENINQRWVPVWVKPSSQSAGNAGLVERGARWLPDGTLELKLLTLDNGALSSETPSDSISEAQASFRPEPAARVTSAQTYGSGEAPRKSPDAQTPEPGPGEPSGVPSVDIQTVSFYSLFLSRMRVLTARTPATVEDLLAHMDIAKSQLQEWLKRAINDGHIRRLQKPVRYEWRVHEPVQGSMFDRN
jgi:predicted Rossmann fold nucleotide-binding protein DprA/Smf involved in DNA uptake